MTYEEMILYPLAFCGLWNIVGIPPIKNWGRKMVTQTFDPTMFVIISRKELERLRTNDYQH